MTQCSGCGATMTEAAQWCSQCYLPRSSGAQPSAPVERSIMSGTFQQAASIPPPPMVKTRWRKTTTTYGPVGRISWTLFLVVVLVFFIFGSIVTGGLGLAGLGAWGFVVMPMALRSIWKAGQLPAG